MALDVQSLPHDTRFACARIVASLRGRVGVLDRQQLGNGPERLALSFAYQVVDDMLAEVFEQLMDTQPPRAS